MEKFERGDNFVTIFRRKGKDRIKKPLRCMYCGKLLCRQIGEITVVADCEVAETDSPFEILCKGCNTLYILN